MSRLAILACGLMVSAELIAVALAGAQDPCLLTMSEARELGGDDAAQAMGDASKCSYSTRSNAARVSIELVALESVEGRELVEELGDTARFTARQKGKVTIWTSRDDELAGWVRRGDRLAAVRAAGEATPKRRRALEQALFRAADRLR